MDQVRRRTPFDAGGGQRRAKRVRAARMSRDLDERATELADGVGVGPGASQLPVSARELFRGPVEPARMEPGM